ncbi:ABC transporter permease [Viridibacillus sp. YIM B01967]|uniref:ABC transporter permease n=1 Tax=Viridibacillus soli TaxID=2798301 RepID=A0ABS1HC68_9BACL|nr:ABC transporter permease [Viridibacillus soli]MBK3497049.1 ABC transporter permease [Viridibacillus soli]
MINILKAKFLLLKRNPVAYIVTTIIICIFTYLMGLGQETKEPIALSSTLNSEQNTEMIKELQKLSQYDFTMYEEKEALKQVKVGKVDVAISLKDEGYKLIVAADFMDGPMLGNELNTIYSQILLKHAIIQSSPDEQQEQVTNKIEEIQDEPSFNIGYKNLGNENGVKWDQKLRSLFGFTLFMVIYTIASGVNHIVMERRNRIWERITVSAIPKWKVYLANLTYSFLLGYLQIALVLSIFYFGVGVDFYGGFWKSLIVVIPYVLCIVSLSIFIAAIANTPGKFNAYMSILAVPLAMLGGAYWPLEIVTSEIMLALSKITPIKYGIDLLNGVTVNSSSIGDLLYPFSILLFMTIIFMGIGINVLEKKEQI